MHAGLEQADAHAAPHSVSGGAVAGAVLATLAAVGCVAAAVALVLQRRRTCGGLPLLRHNLEYNSKVVEMS